MLAPGVDSAAEKVDQCGPAMADGGNSSNITDFDCAALQQARHSLRPLWSRAPSFLLFAAFIRWKALPFVEAQKDMRRATEKAALKWRDGRAWSARGSRLALKLGTLLTGRPDGG